MLFGGALGFSAGTAIWTWRYLDFKAALRRGALTLAVLAVLTIGFQAASSGWQA